MVDGYYIILYEMKSYIQHTIANNPECIVLHGVTNNLRQNTTAIEIGQKTLVLAVSCKSDSNNILISGIVPSRDKFNAKAAEADWKFVIGL